MNVWIEKFNHESDIICKKSARQKRKYTFTQHIVEKLVVDPNIFNAKACMDELKQENAKTRFSNVTLYDCGFFYILYMDNFSDKVMVEFYNNAIPDLRKVLAVDLIEARQNKGNIQQLMEMSW